MSALLGGTWSGYFAYPDGTKRDWSFTVDKAQGDVFVGSGKESRGAFSLVAGQAIPAGQAVTVTFAQEYTEIWKGQIWTYRGTLSGDQNTITGTWYDSPADDRNRVGTFVVQRNLSPFSGKWAGTYKYPDGSEKAISLEVEPFTAGGTFSGTGNDGANFHVTGQTVPGVTGGKSAVTWIQTYTSQWQGQVWFWDGVLNAQGNEIDGSWHDSSADGRGRNATFTLKRA